MMTVKEVSRLTGVSIRTLQYYDKIGLLRPTVRTEAGYRLYDDAALKRLQQIMLFREVEFPLKEIHAILDSPAYDQREALEEQIKLLMLKRNHLDGLISFAIELKVSGGKIMKFNAFDHGKLEQYAREAKERWEGTAAYDEFCGKSNDRSEEAEAALSDGLMEIFTEFGKIKAQPYTSKEAQALG